MCVQSEILYLNSRDRDGLDVTSRMIDVVVVVQEVIDCLWKGQGFALERRTIHWKCVRILQLQLLLLLLLLHLLVVVVMVKRVRTDSSVTVQMIQVIHMVGVVVDVVVRWQHVAGRMMIACQIGRRFD